jgi:hypothetical protein
MAEGVENPLLPDLKVYPADDEPEWSGLVDHNGIGLYRPRQPIGFIDFDRRIVAPKL